MFDSPLQLFIDVTFNLALIDDSVITISNGWKKEVSQLILSACNWCPTMLTRLSIQPFSPEPTQIAERCEVPVLPSTPLVKRGSSIVRGRQSPFPNVPIFRRSTASYSLDNILLQQRYSTSPSTSLQYQPDDEGVAPRGRTLRRSPPRRPTLLRSDSRTLSPESTSPEEFSPILQLQHRRRTTLRSPPFPLPHRVVKTPVTKSPARLDKQRNCSVPPKRIPPPLRLEPSFRLEDEDSPILGREEARRLQQLCIHAVQ